MNKRSQNGFSLISVLVAMGISVIVMMAILSFMTNQGKEMRATDEKMGLQSTQTIIANVMSSPSYCSCFIGAQTFNYTTKTWNGFPTAMSTSYSPTCASVGGDILRVGTKIGSTNFLPTSMSVQNIAETIVGGGTFKGDLIIQFDANKLARARKDLSIPFFFRVNMTDPVNARRIDTCYSSAGGGGGSGTDMESVCLQLGGLWVAGDTPPCKLTYQ